MYILDSTLQFDCLYAISSKRLFSTFSKKEIHFLKTVFDKIFFEHLIKQWLRYYESTIHLTIFKINFSAYSNLEYYSICMCRLCADGLIKFGQIGICNDFFPRTTKSAIEENLHFYNNQINLLERYLERNFQYEIFRLEVVLNFKYDHYMTIVAENEYNGLFSCPQDDRNYLLLDCLKCFSRCSGSELAIYNVVDFGKILKVCSNSKMTEYEKLKYFLNEYRTFLNGVVSYKEIM